MEISSVFPFDIDIANEKWSRLLKRDDGRTFYIKRFKNHNLLFTLEIHKTDVK
jgi:hypothetical protein